MASSSEEQRKQPEKEDESEAATVAAAATAAEEERPSEVFYRTKVVQFLGRSTPIILQNDNGPCPLLAICNVLLLRNNISLSLDTSEVSQQKLLSLVAERLLDSNSNTEGKDEGYVKNQQKNISDAIEVLPKLAKGIDVNVLFRRINDFEFTSECAIFDLLDIGLYHGWIVDPQDAETAEAIGLKSYNALVADLVALDTRNTEGEDKSIEEDCIDFAAATTAALGIPSPCLSRGVSFDEPPVTSPGGQRGRRGDLEEEEELMRILNLSKDEVSMPVIDSLSLDAYRSNISESAEESTPFKTSGSGVHAEAFEGQTNDRTEMSNRSELLSHEINRSNDHVDDVILSEVILRERDTSSLKAATGNNLGQSSVEGSGDIPVSSNSTEIMRPDVLIQQQTLQCLSPDTNDSVVDYAHKGLVDGVGEDQSISQTFVQENYSLQNLRSIDNQSNDSSAIFACQAAPADLHSCDGRQELVEVPQGVSLSLEGSEPLYEGEECMLDPKLPIYENREPIYEGEMIFADQANKGVEEISRVCSKDEATQKQWQLVRTFLKNSASQLTIYGLFCLQEGLKERELCVFFRNNHFSTMFKFKDELYLLATDQGYINQPDLVWEKLNEVNGDTVFMTGNFMEFKVENQVNDSWSERNAMTDYLTMEGSTPDNSTLNSDLQLALALQQEFDQQPQSQPQQGSQQSSGIGRSRLVTGPQVRNGPSSSSKQDSKSKDKCIVM